MTTTITPEQQAAIATYLEGRHIAAGLGTKEEPCSIAAINLALSGQLTDEIPGCMSVVIGGWIIGVQDAMPDKMRNGKAWRRLLPLAAGTGRQHEAKRLDIILDWVWETVFPTLHPQADFSAQHRQSKAAAEIWSAEVAETAARWGAEAAEAAATWAAKNAGTWAANVGKNNAATWELFDPPALLEKLITLDGGTPND